MEDVIKKNGNGYEKSLELNISKTKIIKSLIWSKNCCIFRHGTHKNLVTACGSIQNVDAEVSCYE